MKSVGHVKENLFHFFEQTVSVLVCYILVKLHSSACFVLKYFREVYLPLIEMLRLTIKLIPLAWQSLNQ